MIGDGHGMADWQTVRHRATSLRCGRGCRKVPAGECASSQHRRCVQKVLVAVPWLCFQTIQNGQTNSYLSVVLPLGGVFQKTFDINDWGIPSSKRIPTPAPFPAFEHPERNELEEISCGCSSTKVCRQLRMDGDSQSALLTGQRNDVRRPHPECSQPGLPMLGSRVVGWLDFFGF